ncbi:hypothetical protein PVW48_05555 [Dinoroseobacter sp. PD6]|uniref:MGH1-like glycoside hydrolase domain-containing protein n=1 Tax=Dinoroseobacter sp. PD6 TaxID=3028384 RepID=UPI00237C02F8|nr:hypothetical protein [Dinoroseobacter sp. PD6]MDD9716200.1 hypothetical protein [Dinoroseobacter sp. PD6]
MKDTMDAAALDAEAERILRMNDRGGYSVPTAGLYPYQWNWDSAFAALGYAMFDLPRGWRELEVLMAGQWADGMVPHIQFHNVDPSYFPGPDIWGGVGPVPSSGISQPPIAATMARLIYELDPSAGAAPMRALYPKFIAWHRWFMDWRLDAGAACLTHPWEAGRDNAPDWDGPLARIEPVGIDPYERRDTGHVDPSMRPKKSDYDRYLWLVKQGHDCGWDQARLLEINPFRMADPTMHFTLLRAHRDLAWLGRELGLDTASLPDWIAQLEAGAETLWNAALGAYDVRDTASGAWAQAVSNAAFLCWYAGIDPKDSLATYARVQAPVRFGVASHDPESPAFEPKRYWRGPSWAMMNMLIAMGFDEAGLPEGAALRDSTARLIAENGFAEYFDPLTGAPAGGRDFTWTAAVWLAWCSPNVGRGRWAR